MNETTQDVAVIGYGPVGVTAANLLGQLGLRVLVVERDADVYARARAISTDEEVVRIWHRIGLADRLTADMLADRAISFVGARGRTFLSVHPADVGKRPPHPAVHLPARAGADAAGRGRRLPERRGTPLVPGDRLPQRAARHPAGAARRPPRGRRAHPAAVGP